VVGFEHATCASKGARSYQEDAVEIRSEPVDPGDGRAERLIAVLADGMGGHAGGAFASSTACEAFVRAYHAAAGDAPTRLDEALHCANRAIAGSVEDNPALDGMGCTLVGTDFSPAGLQWVSVGDSPLFLVRGGGIALLNADHSLAPEIDKLAAAGKMSWEDARLDPRRHYLRSAVTGAEIELIDRSPGPVALDAGDIVIVASDGIQTLSQRAILDVVEAYAAGGPDAVARALLAAIGAVGEPHQDNATVIVVGKVD
jgi:serine/threonine protein phosphatase PrpC